MKIAAMGGVGVSLGFAAGGLAIGFVAVGGCAMSYYAIGGGAFGVHALGGNVQDAGLKAFFESLTKYKLAVVGLFRYEEMRNLVEIF